MKIDRIFAGEIPAAPEPTGVLRRSNALSDGPSERLRLDFGSSPLPDCRSVDGHASTSAAPTGPMLSQIGGEKVTTDSALGDFSARTHEILDQKPIAQLRTNLRERSEDHPDEIRGLIDVIREGDVERDKKLRFLLSSLVVLGLLAGSFVFGFLVHRTEMPPYRTIATTESWVRQHPTLGRLIRSAQTSGVWAKTPRRGAAGLSAHELAELQALGYVGATEEAPDASGVVVYDPESAYAGLNLYNSGHAPEAILMDMNGEVLHRWSLSFAQAFPDVVPPPGALGPYAWRRVHLYDNGDLLAIFEGIGIIRIDADSNLIWAKNNGAHHDIHVMDDTEIFVLTRKTHVVPRFHEWKPVVEDFITVLGPDGVERRSYSILDAVMDSQFEPLMQSTKKSRDIFHANSIEILDSRYESVSPFFKAGNALVSMRELNFVGIIDLEENRVVWGLPPLFSGQHDPTFVNGGDLLVLDNKGHHGFTRVVEIDPLTQEIAWGYYGDGSNGFFTSCCGVNQRLPNGNTLITESDGGRAFELTRDNRIVWDFLNPNRGGEDGDLIGRLFEVRRIEPDVVAWWRSDSTPDVSAGPR
jgi:hypothetical protein